MFGRLWRPSDSGGSRTGGQVMWNVFFLPYPSKKLRVIRTVLLKVAMVMIMILMINESVKVMTNNSLITLKKENSKTFT